GLRLQFIESGVAAILNEKLVATGVTDAGHRRWGKGNDQSFWNFGANARVHFRQNRRQSLLTRFSLGEFLERQKDCGRVRLIAAEEIKSCELDRVEYAGSLVRNLRNLVDDSLRTIERRRVRELGINDGVSAILRRKKTAGHDFETETGQTK